jgi:hypothetical protein
VRGRGEDPQHPADAEQRAADPRHGPGPAG